MAIEDRGLVVLAVTTAMIVASSIFIILRVVSRVAYRRGPRWRSLHLDDWIILSAWAIAFGFSFSICYGTSVGLGHHEHDVLPEWREPLKKSYYAFSVLYNPALMATKTSILIFYLSLSEGQHAVFRWAAIGTLVVVDGAGLALTFLNIFQCRPVGVVFKDPIPSTAHCTDIVTLYLCSAPVNIITDLAILFLPMPVLTGMRLPRRQKIILVVTFSFGAFVTVVDVVRIVYLQQASIARLQEVGNTAGDGIRRSEDDDFSWYASLSFMWSAVEVNIGIMCACIPSLKPLVSHLLPSMLHKRSSATEQSGSLKSTVQQVELAPSQKLPSIPGGQGASRQNGSIGDMDIVNFLSTPYDAEKTTTTEPVIAVTTHTTRRGSLAFFDFVDVENGKCLVRLSHKESVFPIAIVTVLFFIWGFAYALLDALNGQFEQVVQMDTGKKLALHGAYFAGYLIGPLTFGRIVLEKWGFKASFIVGLLTYSCGTLLFWPSAVLTSFTAFLISNLIVGLGLSSLEIAANPFVALCGPPEYGEFRLNLSQAFQGIGGVLAPLLAKKVLFKGATSSAPSLIDSQWAYLGIALFDVLLALGIYYSPLPEATNEELEEMEERRGASIDNDRHVLGIPVIYLTLGLGVFSQACSVSAHKALDSEFAPYIPIVKPNANLPAFDYRELGFMCFPIGRFLSAFACLVAKPRYILLAEYLAIIIMSVLAMNLTGYAGVSMFIIMYLPQAGLFPIIFAMCLRGLGAKVKLGSAFLTASVSGGAILPVIMDPIVNSRGVQYSLCVLVAAYVFGGIFPIYCNLVPAARKQVDPHERRTHLRRGLQEG